MSSLRDAMRRLEIIYNECAPEAQAEKGLNGKKDDFLTLKKTIHQDVKACRIALKEREENARGALTSVDSAEQSYRIRLMIKKLKDDAHRMSEIQAKESRKKKHPQEELDKRREIVELVNKHIEEVEQLEKKRFTDKVGSDRVALFTRNDGTRATAESRYRIASSGRAGKPDPYLDSQLPDIEAAENMKRIKDKDKQVNDDLDEISGGVKKLKDIAGDMNAELDRQNGQLDELDTKVDKVLEHMDNVNVKMKKVIEKYLKGDKFIVYLILISLILCLVGYAAYMFLN